MRDMLTSRFRSLSYRPPFALFSIPSFVYAALLSGFAGGVGLVLLTSVAVTVHALVHLLPWRVPRNDRSVLGYWFETAVCAVPLAAGTLAWAIIDPGGALFSAPISGRLLAGLAAAPFAAAAMIWLSGISLSALRSGDLAFLAAPLPLHRAVARITSVASAVFAEEVIFRAVPAGLTSYGTLAMAAGAAAFVSGHHMVRGSGERWNWRMVRYEVSAAVLFAGLVGMSGSVWPAVAAHALTNAPQVTLDLQRAEPSQASEVASG